ncbi:YhgE/Pip family protein, partial [Agromyces seonyuensis]|nr:hypothetical protein [Agromyces seonyuensis]
MSAPRAFAGTAGAPRFRALAIVGLLLLPVAVGGLLAWSLADPTGRLDRVTAAIVNDDAPVDVNGQTVPLGRQFAAGLLADDDSGDFDWVLTNDDEAAAGLATGRYAAVLTIPSSFSADATSLGGDAADVVQASLAVTTTPASALFDPSLTAAVTSAATAELNQQLIAQYLTNVYQGFNTIGEQIGQAASGASALADGADSLADGARSLADGANDLADGLGSLDAGAGSLANGLDQLDDAVQALPGRTAELAAGAGEVAAGADALAGGVAEATTQFAAVVAQVCALPGPGDLCTRATAALAQLQAANADVGALAAGANGVAAGNGELAAAVPGLVEGVDAADAGAGEVAAG